MPLLTRLLTTAAIVPLLALSAPLAASAAAPAAKAVVAGSATVAAEPAALASDTAPYPVGKPDTWSRTITPKTIVTHTVPAGVFTPNARLDITVTSECPAPTLATFAAAQLSGQLMSDADGGAVVKLDFGASTCGVYDVTVSEQGSPYVSYGVVTVVTDPAADPASVTDPASASNTLLAHTGTSISGAVLWAAGLLLAAGGALWGVARLRRRVDS